MLLSKRTDATGTEINHAASKLWESRRVGVDTCMARMSAWAASKQASVNFFRASPGKRARLTQPSIEVGCASLRTSNRHKNGGMLLTKTNQPNSGPHPNLNPPALDIFAHHQKKREVFGFNHKKKPTKFRMTSLT